MIYASPGRQRRWWRRLKQCCLAIAQAMDWITPLRNLTLLSIGLPVAVCTTASGGSLAFLRDVRFYAVLYASWWLHFLLWALYRIFVHPKHLSSLRHLPEPTVCIT